MGNRALVIMYTPEEVSVTTYLHWDGSNVKEYLEGAGPRMRKGDVTYAAARFIGYCHERIDGALSLGVFETPQKVKDAIKGGDALGEVMNEYSHGDEGVFLVNLGSGFVSRFDSEEEGFEIDLFGG